jgi:agmatine deiminase
MELPIPPEWAPHGAIWTAWPSAADLWLENLAPARAEVGAMVRALAGEGGDRMRVLANGPEAVASARAALGDAAEVIDAPFGDIWLRDTGPIFDGRGGGVAFTFNGWGGKYVLEHDDRVADLVAARAGVALRRHAFVLEGGAVEMDGEGTVLTTRQCLLNPNRNEGWDEPTAERALAAALGARKVIWLGDGLLHDHTDGHVDNVARFVGPGRVVCQHASGADDPNTAALDAIAEVLGAATDAAGRRLEVIRIPSPGLVLDEDGEAIPASHMNFLIGQRTVVVPTYSAHGEAAVRALAPLFPGRRVIDLPSHAILTGGGSFHCITQQEPA